jgi:hypothetical protein
MTVRTQKNSDETWGGKQGKVIDTYNFDIPSLPGRFGRESHALRAKSSKISRE